MSEPRECAVQGCRSPETSVLHTEIGELPACSRCAAMPPGSVLVVEVCRTVTVQEADE